MMDRNCPDFLCDTAESGARDSEALITALAQAAAAQLYAITPRFAPTSTEAQLALTGELARAYPDTYHPDPRRGKHRTRSPGCKTLYPQARSYLDVYDRYGLLRQRAMYGHCI